MEPGGRRVLRSVATPLVASFSGGSDGRRRPLLTGRSSIPSCLIERGSPPSCDAVENADCRRQGTLCPLLCLHASKQRWRPAGRFGASARAMLHARRGHVLPIVSLPTCCPRSRQPALERAGRGRPASQQTPTARGIAGIVSNGTSRRWAKGEGVRPQHVLGSSPTRVGVTTSGAGDGLDLRPGAVCRSRMHSVGPGSEGGGAATEGANRQQPTTRSANEECWMVAGARALPWSVRVPVLPCRVLVVLLHVPRLASRDRPPEPAPIERAWSAGCIAPVRVSALALSPTPSLSRRTSKGTASQAGRVVSYGERWS